MSRDWRREAELRRQLDRATTPRRSPVPVLLWNWRKELVIVGAAVTVALIVAGTFGPLMLLAVGSALIGLGWPPWPDHLKGLYWQLVTPHLLRSGLYHAGIHNRNGKLPFIVRVTREPFGERLRLRCPPGTCAEDLYYARDVLRAACRAIDVRVTRDQWRAHLVTVDVVRWPPSEDPPAGHPGQLAA